MVGGETVGLSLRVPKDKKEVPIVPGDARTLQIKPYFDDKAIPASDVEWSVADGEGDPIADADEDPLGTISNLGTYTAPEYPYVEDRSGVRFTHRHVCIKGTYTDDNGEHPASLKLELRLGWPSSWPYLADTVNLAGFVNWDSDDQGKRAAVILWDLLAQLPEGFLRRIPSVPIVRNEELEQPFHSPVPTAFVVMNDLNINLIDFYGGPSGPGEPPTDGEREVGFAFLHELAHAVMTYECGGEAILGKALAGIINVPLRYWLNAGLIGTAIFALPALPVVWIGWLAHIGWSHSVGHDFMSTYADAIGWKTNAMSMASFPLLGFFLPHILTEPPNVITAFGGGDIGQYIGHNPYVNLRNDLLAAAIKKVNPAKPKNPTPAQQQAIVKAFDGVSWYGTFDPHEDWAEACCEKAIGQAHLNTFHDEALSNRADGFVEGENVFMAANKKRRDLIEKNGFFPPKEEWEKEKKEIRFGRIVGEYDGWEVETPAAASKKVKDDGLRKFAALMAEWEEGPGPAVRETERVVLAIREPVETPTRVELLKTLELHGDGLRRFKGKNVNSSPGNVLVSRDENPWVVTKTNDEGLITQATGLVDVDIDKPKQDYELQREDVLYHWGPSEKPRSYTEGQPVAEAYEDADAVIKELVGLWGRTETAEKKPRSVEGIGAFFAEAMRIAGLASDEFALPKEPDGRDVKAFCLTHGAGLRTWAPGAFDVRVGDWIFFFDDNLAALVTRVEDGAPIDAIAGGQLPLLERNNYRDLIEPESNSVQMFHDIDPLDVHYVWQPSTELRKFGAK